MNPVFKGMLIGAGVALLVVFLGPVFLYMLFGSSTLGMFIPFCSHKDRG